MLVVCVPMSSGFCSASISHYASGSRGLPTPANSDIKTGPICADLDIHVVPSSKALLLNCVTTKINDRATDDLLLQGMRGRQKAIELLADGYNKWRDQIWASAAAAKPAAAIADPCSLANALEESIKATAHEARRNRDQDEV